MNHILQILTKLLKGAKEAIDREGLIALLTNSIANDNELEEVELSEMVYNEFIDQLHLNIPKNKDYRANIYSYYRIQKKPNDTILIDMMMNVFHIKRFDSELFIFTDKGWQKVSDDKLQDLVSKMVQVLLVDFRPSQSVLRNVVEGLQKSSDIENLSVNEQYIGCGPNMFDLSDYKVVKNNIEVFPKTRLNLDLDLSDSISDTIPVSFNQYMFDLANHDEDLKSFLIQHTSVLLTADAKLRRGLILYGTANNGKSVYIKLLKSFFYSNDVLSKTLNELGGRFDKESLIGKRLMASDEIGEARINERVVNDFKKLLSVEPIHVDRKGQTQVEVTLDLKLIFNTNAVLNFPAEHAKALERRIAVIPCDFYVQKADSKLNDKLQIEKKDIFLYLMYVYKQILSNDTEKLENERVTNITHDWLNFGYYFIASKTVSINKQKDCIRLIRNLTSHNKGSRVKVSKLNNVIKQEMSLSSQFIKELVMHNLNSQIISRDGYEYWTDLAWNNDSNNDKNESLERKSPEFNVTESEFQYTDENTWPQDEEGFLK